MNLPSAKPLHKPSVIKMLSFAVNEKRVRICVMKVTSGKAINSYVRM